MDRLYGALLWSRDRLLPFRETRKHILKEFVGRHYSDNGAEDRVPFNLLKLYTNIYLRMLVARNPKALVTTHVQALKPLAADLETWMNWRISTLDLDRTLRTVVQDALFCMGIVKIGITAGPEVQYEGFTHYMAEPFVDPIDLDDWVHDMTAKRWSECAFMGHRYRMPLSAVRNNGLFDGVSSSGQLRREEIQGQTQRQVNEKNDERVTSLQQDMGAMPGQEYTDYVELWDLWLQHENVIVTVEYNPASGFNAEPLRVVEWRGPKSGPFLILTYVDVPSNTMPSGPVTDQLDLHLLYNETLRKLGRQSNREKTVLAVQGGAMSDADRIQKASDGDIVRVDNPENMKEVQFGGVDQSQMAFLIQLYQIFNRSGGNLETIGGLSSQAGTLGQEELLASQSSNQLKDMQDRTVIFAREVFRQLAWYWMNDPIQTYEAERSIPGVEFTATARITPQDRDGTFERLNFDIHPYSMQGQTPSQMAQKLNTLMTQIIMPAMPLLQQQGIGPDIQAFLRLIAKYEDIPDLDTILRFEEPMGQDEVKTEPPRKPVTSNRTYTRRNVSQGGSGRDDAMMATLMGSGNDSDAANAMGG